MDERAVQVAEQFALPGPVGGAERYTAGHINDSYLVTVEHALPPGRFFLQRINRSVFPRPIEVMENIARVTRHLREALEREAAGDPSRKCLTLVPARSGAGFVRDTDGSVWRTYRFIEDSVCRETPASEREVYQAGRAFGDFQRRLADYAGPPLHETIPFFHDTPRRLAAMERAAGEDRAGRASGCMAELATARDHRELAEALTSRAAHGGLPTRIVHHDAKLSNVLFDRQSGESLCVVDLDTVMPGLALYDFGDMARSMTSEAAEDEPDPARVRIRLDFFEALTRGYLETAGPMLTPAERDLLVTAARVITYEQGLRFLTDYLEGDRYFRVTRPEQNRDRCRVQLTLLCELDAHASELERLVARTF